MARPLVNLKIRCEHIAQLLVNPLQIKKLKTLQEFDNCVMARRMTWSLVNLKIGCEHTTWPLVNPL